MHCAFFIWMLRIQSPCSSKILLTFSRCSPPASERLAAVALTPEAGLAGRDKVVEVDGLAMTTGFVTNVGPETRGTGWPEAIRTVPSLAASACRSTAASRSIPLRKGSDGRGMFEGADAAEVDVVAGITLRGGRGGAFEVAGAAREGNGGRGMPEGADATEAGVITGAILREGKGGALEDT